MKRLALALALLATPAAAHHEVVVATSILPLLGGMVAVVLAGLTAWRSRVRQKRQSQQTSNG